MNRVALKKRIEILEMYKGKVDEKSDLAKHLFNETKRRVDLLKFNVREREEQISSLSCHFKTGEVGKGLLANIYGHISNIERELVSLRSDLDVALKEYKRRLADYKKLKVKSIGLDGLIQRNKNRISELDSNQDRIFLDEWVLQSSLAKRK
ncbi:hypothetical protein [Vibrio hepatarius]|uniref:hypothetical protein n=1 Tax=Vibrio hepatarius TaxID=171383 RepID=UPI001C083624|nr:hypothetical protein [Vibrio hepatarius]MBU2895965.1 hypothetical protein [Vibrio hepatarius]